MNSDCPRGTSQGFFGVLSHDDRSCSWRHARGCAQSNASIVGRGVTDESGGVLPGVNVTATARPCRCRR